MMTQEQILKYDRRVKKEIVLTDDERKEIAKRIVEFMRSCLDVSEDISESENKTKYKWFYYSFNNSVCSYYFNKIYEKNGKFELTDQEILYHWDVMFQRFYYFIRMNGSVIHMNKLVEILGKKLATHYLESWAKKNMIIALMLKEYVNKLETEVIQ
jgi:hypothetical protein